ncbi:FMN-linked oxidoreductase [Didymella exigua CBS 183.55]|uniref:FMN-linked oxidoreductase n=1 Tax=Didymella exigua CBS 183.55 TaxID=1150837 RepID=A0A6A5R5I9_9PLEO|nr:FMN-linked oxidoreductase [Didymella exigua CBS 183.55]KAF1922972.1 FMN-linked oxidoreductase [Didymella exigua CBS 183.55]
MIATETSIAPSLLEPFPLSPSLTLRNRICMGSMTRNRNTDANKPTSAAAQYYSARARHGAGLIIAEGTWISPTGSEWQHGPLMTSASHAGAWKPVTDAVHAVGGTIFFQPWHQGRAQHDLAPMLKQTGYPVLAPSAIQAKAGKYRFLPGAPGHTRNITAMTRAHIADVVEQYRHASALARGAGFDGVEIIAQGGYLVHNFLSTRSNARRDGYGGSAWNRCRFLLQVVDAIATVYPELSETYTVLVQALVHRGVGFVNLSRRGCETGSANDDFSDCAVRPPGMELPAGYEPLDAFGPLVKCEGSRTKLMVNYGYTVEEAEALAREGRIDLITFGRPFICNPVSLPDLVERIRQNVPLAENDRGGRVNYGPYAHVNDDYNDWPCATWT